MESSVLDDTYRGRWLTEVFRASSAVISPEVQVFLLLLGMHMDGEGVVAVPTDELAATLNCTDRRIRSKFASAVSAHFLEQLVRGGKYRIATYRGITPTSQPDDRRPAETRVQEDDRRPAENSQEDDGRPAEPDSQAASRRPAENSTPAPQEDDGRPAETAPLIRNRARARSGSTYSNHHPAPAVDDRPLEGVVVPLFEREKTTGKTLSERSERLQTSTDRARENPDPFAEFWAVYPRRVGRAAARKAWDKALKNGADPEQIIWAAREYASLPRDPKDGLRFVAHPTTWLNQGRWEDEVEPAPATPARPPVERWQRAGDDALARAMQRALAKEGRL